MEKVKNKYVFVVTRWGRRVEPRNYDTPEEAQERAASLKELLKKWSPRCVDKISILKTENPNTVC
jgi:hypothetical protein|tara:strand:+ start:496 stop:690 length:195 start_codon:yes stop_codon:yes gene_type:complete